MAESLQQVFEQLRALLQQHTGSFTVSDNAAGRYGLQASVGPATVQAWRGKLRAPVIPVAWVELRPKYVSYHLLGLSGYAKLAAGISPVLRAKMQGKTCFNIKSMDPALLQELVQVTAESLRGMQKAGFVSVG